MLSRHRLQYLAVGVVNTLFGYGCFAFLQWALTDHLTHAYLLASPLSSLISITFSFLGYKHFVFKTKGNYFREWVRCLIVYSGNIVIGLLCLPPLVLGLTSLTSIRKGAPYLAQGIVLILGVGLSYFGHSRYSFRSHESSEREA
ncbi:MAG: GtrA family protein [Blastocatellia bacterium]|jgi:putative flippase GtrA